MWETEFVLGFSSEEKLVHLWFRGLSTSIFFYVIYHGILTALVLAFFAYCEKEEVMAEKEVAVKNQEQEVSQETWN